MQERINHPAKWVYKLPPELNYEVGALLEPLSVAIQAVRRAEQCTTPLVRDNWLIFGAGAVGLLTAVAAQAAGVKNIVMADIDQGRLDFAKEMGFATITYTVRPQRSKSVEEGMTLAASTAREIGELKWPDGTAVSRANIAFECTGVPSCVQTSIYVSKPNARVEYLSEGSGWRDNKRTIGQEAFLVITSLLTTRLTGDKIRRVCCYRRPRYSQPHATHLRRYLEGDHIDSYVAICQCVSESNRDSCSVGIGVTIGWRHGP